LYPEEIDERVHGRVHDEAQLAANVPAVVLHEGGGVEGSGPCVHDAGYVPEDVVDEVGHVEDDVGDGVEDDGDGCAALQPALTDLVLLGEVDLVAGYDAADGDGDYGEGQEETIEDIVVE